MQSNFGTQATPLSERLTLILLAQDQPDFLRRALKYYSSYPCSVIVVDASLEADNEVAQTPGLEYVQAGSLTGASFSARVAQGMQRVTTKFVAVAEVDSILLMDGLDASLNFLEANGHYGACQGYSLSYQAQADGIDYFRRERKVQEDYASDQAQDRLLSFMGQSVSLLNAVTRTDLARDWFASVPVDTEPHWQDIGYLSYLAASAGLRILPVPYALHFARSKADQANYIVAIHSALSHIDPKATAEREAYAAFLASALSGVSSHEVLAGFQVMAESLATQPFQCDEKLFSSTWNLALEKPEPRFEPEQFVELPFYNPPFFKALEHIEFLMHVIPAGVLQLKGLEALLLKQVELSRREQNPDAEALVARLWQAYQTYPFNQRIVQSLVASLRQEVVNRENVEKAKEEIDLLVAWSKRLQDAGTPDNSLLFDTMESGKLLRWLESRDPATADLKKMKARLAKNPKGSQITILLLDLDADVFKLQATFDSLINSHYRAFKVIVFTTGDLPVATTIQNTLHFVKVTESNYVDRINQTVKQSGSDWVMLAQAGEQFTTSGLLQASIELIDASHCRAVAMDELHRQPDRTLGHVMRPGFNLDLLQSVPALMAGHWLIRRELMVEAGGYSRDLNKALEFDLLLRLIESGGMSGLAHLSEPVLICQAPELDVNEHEHQALTRHLGNRGYQAEVSSALPGTYKIDYRHDHRPFVSILLESRDDLPELQRCLLSILQRTRYQRYEVLIGDNNSSSAELSAWLDQQQQISSRVRVLRSDQRISSAALRNQLSLEAKGEYLIMLDTQSQIVNVGWIESLLNQAQRPEVGVVGVKLVDREGNVTQAGLIPGFNGGVGSPFVGVSKNSRGYMQRLVVEQNYSAVSAACLMIGKDLYDAVGGLDEGAFADALGDVDLCLKVGQAGYLTVWTPHVQVVHSGVIRTTEAALASLKGKWASPFEQDESYNKNLALNGQGFTLVAL